MIDIVVGLQYGDEGKGKVVNHLAEKNDYDFCIRYNGGPNAGHTIYKNGKKIVTHQIPTGAVHNIQCIIGDNCYVDYDKLVKELNTLCENEIFITQLYVSGKAHLITSDSLDIDSLDEKIGTTKSGIGPCAALKYARNGKRVCDLLSDTNTKLDRRIIICDIHDVIKTQYMCKKNVSVLVEGAQGFGLDITHGDYPYVTSSHCISTDCLNIGIPLVDNKINVYGVCKCYETYVGNKHFQPDNSKLIEIQKTGEEIGATTGRDRQVNYLNLGVLNKSLWINNVNKIIINKYDILNTVNEFKLYEKGKLIKFNDFANFKSYINDSIITNVNWIKEEDITWSCNPCNI